MCVIVYKPAGQACPSISTLKACFASNPDGAGYMLPLNGKVLIRKGFMDYESFEKDFVDTILDNRLDPVATPVVFHFRISTQGGAQKGLCHPFPICRSYKQMRELSQLSDMGLAHNGIISLCSISHYRWDGKKSVPFIPDYNDTMTFIDDYASLIIDNDPDFGENKAKLELLERLSGSKLAIMQGDGRVTLIGKFVKRNGIMYSNDYWMPTKGKLFRFTAEDCYGAIGEDYM